MIECFGNFFGDFKGDDFSFAKKGNNVKADADVSVFHISGCLLAGANCLDHGAGKGDIASDKDAGAFVFLGDQFLV